MTPPGGHPVYEVVGRVGELATVGALLAAGDGPNCLVIRGEPGAGKSTVLDAGLAIAASRGYRCLVTRPADGEQELAFVGLRDLLTPLFEPHADVLPVPQRRALAAALLLDDTTAAPPEPGSVGAAVHNLLQHVTGLDHSPGVLLAVDDTQWLDPPTQRALRFALRRLRRVPLAVLLTARPGNEPGLLPGEDLELPGLTLGALARLVQDRVGVVLPRPQLRRLHEASLGNPLYALEIVRDLVRRGGSDGTAPLPVPPTLHELVDSRLRGLSEGTRQLLALVAAAGRPGLTTLEDAAGRSPLAEIKEAVDAGVLVVDGEEVRFAHPLLGVRVYAGLLDPERRALHARLAAVVRDRPDEQARHVALAATGPDAAAAATIEAAAAGILSRGAVSTAAALYAAAGRLTPPQDAEAAARRGIEQAWCQFLAGDTAEAADHLDRLVADAPTEAHRADALTRRARLLLFTDQLDDAAEHFDRALRTSGASVQARAAAWEGLTWVVLLGRGPCADVERHASAAADLAEETGDRARHTEAEAVLGLVGVLRRDTGGLARVERAAQRVGDVEFARAIQHPVWNLAIASVHTDRLDQAADSLRWLHDRAAERGDESSVTRILFALAHVDLLTGGWSAAAEHVAEGERAAAETGQHALSGMLLMNRTVLAAHLGDADAVRAAGTRPDRGVAERLSDQLAAGLLALSRGDAEAAESALAPLVARWQAAGIVEPGAMRFAVDEVEALIELGRLADATACLDRLAAAAEAAGRVSVLAGAARCRGLLAAAGGRGERSLEVATAAFTDALALHDRLSMPFDRARTLLAYGTVLRRGRRRRAARDALAEAGRVFDELGAAVWSARAETEAARIGGRAPSGELTDTEWQVVDLAADGLTNVEIAARLFVSHKTVEAHLSHAYVKLGVRSRASLARALAAKR